MRYTALAALVSAAPAIAADPPAVSREFRGVWVATLANIDWPSKPGLPAVVPVGDFASGFLDLGFARPERLIVTAYDRPGNESDPTEWKR